MKHFKFLPFFLPLLLLMSVLVITIALGGCQFRSSHGSSGARYPSPQVQTVEVVNVHDGDTMRVSLNGKEERIRAKAADG